jgi:hypothetical protein
MQLMWKLNLSPKSPSNDILVFQELEENLMQKRREVNK